MMRRKVVKGTVILAAAVSAALSACDDDTANGGNAGAGGDDSGSGGGDTTGGTGGTGATGGTGGTGASGGSGGTDLGGLGGMAGDGNEPPPTAAELVDEFCADGPTYTIVEGTSGDDTYAEYSVSTATAIVAFEGEDELSSTGTSEGSPLPVCFIGGDDDDLVYLWGNAGGSSGEYAGSAVALTFAGGDGADQFDYRVGPGGSMTNYRPPFQFKDFESGVDEIVINPGSGSTYVDSGAGIAWVSAFEATTAHPNAYTDSASFAVVVDTTDNEVWFSYYNEGVQQNSLVGVVEGDTLTTGDVVFPAPPPI